MMRKRALAALLPLLLPMCSGGGGSNGDDSPLGPTRAGSAPVRVYLTDKPAEDFTKVNVTISSIRMHQSAAAADGSGGWVELPIAAPMPVDLLVLRDGVLLTLGLTQLPVGNYQQIRLGLTPNAGPAPPYSNFAVTAAGEHPIDVPSGTVKIVHPFSVVEGQTTELTLDFDASLSVKRRGNGTFFMSPVIRASSSTTPTAD